MTNVQTRLLASTIAMLAGAVLANSSSVNENFGIAIVLLGLVAFVAEYVRSRKG
jgi:branched-subunit amino acid ABC-type transport system permease component